MLQFIACTLVVGVAIGYVFGGRVRNLGRLDIPLRWLAVVWGALALQLLSGVLPSSFLGVDLGQAAILTSYAVLGLALVVAAARLFGKKTPLAYRLGVVLVSAGWLANAVVIAANGGMPVSRRALVQSGRTLEDAAGGGGTLDKTILASSDTTLGFLGDSLAVPALRVPVSVGDVALSLGLLVIIIFAMSEPRRNVMRPHSPRPLTGHPETRARAKS